METKSANSRHQAQSIDSARRHSLAPNIDGRSLTHSEARDNHLIEVLKESEMFRTFEQSFSRATGLPIGIRPVESWQLPLHGKKNEGPFCQIMAEQSRTCAACLQFQQQIIEEVDDTARTVTCQYGLCDSAVPIKLGSRTIGFLQTGQIFNKEPSQSQFKRTMELLRTWDVEVDRERLEEAYFKSKVISSKVYQSMVTLLQLFAQHLSIHINQIAVRQENAEPAFIVKAKAYIHENYAEPLSLNQVAKAVNASSFYFCKMFKKVTGINFTEYVSRIRIERAKNLLLNPNLRVSEIAYEVGFQSLTHFNRVFRNLAGQSPTRFRSKLPAI